MRVYESHDPPGQAFLTTKNPSFSATPRVVLTVGTNLHRPKRHCVAHAQSHDHDPHNTDLDHELKFFLAPFIPLSFVHLSQLKLPKDRLKLTLEQDIRPTRKSTSLESWSSCMAGLQMYS